uniref:histidine kinase n=1 Tax=uncultured Bacillota bacterium TaxID=344338 RepID=A0A650F4M0_9FIRM|nr:hypothetical protein Firmicute1046_1210 [uncultured Firmicutes bacterium]
MSDEIRSYTDAEKFNEARMLLHRFYKNMSHGYMLSQSMLKAENLYPDQHALMAKIQHIFVACLRYVTDLNFMQENDALTQPRIAQHSICEVLQSIADTLNEILFIDTDAHIDFQYKGEDILMDLDVPRMEYILFSVIENSLQYGPKDVKITLGLKKTDKQLYITIKEKSAAIAEKDFEALFSKYKKITSGTINPTVHQGLSLALAKQAALEMDGNLLAENQKTGLKITLILPMRSTHVKEKDTAYTLAPEKVIVLFADYLLRKAEAQSNENKC